MWGGWREGPGERALWRARAGYAPIVTSIISRRTVSTCPELTRPALPGHVGHKPGMAAPGGWDAGDAAGHIANVPSIIGGRSSASLPWLTIARFSWDRIEISRS